MRREEHMIRRTWAWRIVAGGGLALSVAALALEVATARGFRATITAPEWYLEVNHGTLDVARHGTLTDTVSLYRTWDRGPESFYWWEFSIENDEITASIWSLALPPAVPAIWLVWRRLTRLRRSPAHCPCGYDLAGTPAGQPCPECGNRCGDAM